MLVHQRSHSLGSLCPVWPLVYACIQVHCMRHADQFVLHWHIPNGFRPFLGTWLHTSLKLLEWAVHVSFHSPEMMITATHRKLRAG